MRYGMTVRSRFLLMMLLVASCSRTNAKPEEFAVVRDSLSSQGGVEAGPTRSVFLNEEIRIGFDGPVDPLSVTPDTVRVRDLGDGQLVRGRLSVSVRALTFAPLPPCSPNCDDGSFKPGRSYRIEVVGFPSTNGVRSNTGRLLRRSFTREFTTVLASREPSPFLPVGVGDPRCERFELTFFEPVAAEVGTLRLHFNVPPHPATVTAAAFHLQRLNSGVEAVEIRAARVLPPSDQVAGNGEFGRVSPSFPGCIVELQVAGRLVPGRDLYLGLEHGSTGLRDYAGRPVLDFAGDRERLPIVAVPVQPGDRLRVFEVGFRERMEFVTANPNALGFVAGDGTARPSCRNEAGSGRLGVLRPTRDLVIAAGVPFDRGDGTLVTCDSPSFEFHAIDIPVGVTVVLRASRPTQLRARDSIRIAGSLVLDRTPLGTRACMDGEPMSAQELVEGSGVALIAGGDVTVSGSVVRDAGPGDRTGAPFAVLCGGRARLFGRIPAGCVLAPENLVLEGAAALAKIVRAPLTRAAPPGAATVAEAWTPWLPLPRGRTRADEVRIEGLVGKLAVAVQLAPPNPLDASRPVEDESCMTQPLPLPLTVPLEWTPGSHVRFLLRAELAPGQPLPEIAGIAFLSR